MTNLGDAQMLAYVGWSPSSRVIYGSPPDVAEMNCWKKLLSEGDLFLDVGASVGIYSLWTASLGARVTAVEADHESLEKLHENAALNPTLSIEIVDKAASNGEGFVSFKRGHRATSSLGDSGSRVASTTIDAILDERHARGLKIDVEGYEQTILAGAGRALSENRIDVLQLEWNRRSVSAVGRDRRPVWEMLRAHGYEFARPTIDGHLHTAISPDFGPDLFALSPNSGVEVGSPR